MTRGSILLLLRCAQISLRVLPATDGEASDAPHTPSTAGAQGQTYDGGRSLPGLAVLPLHMNAQVGSPRANPSPSSANLV